MDLITGDRPVGPPCGPTGGLPDDLRRAEGRRGGQQPEPGDTPGAGLHLVLDDRAEHLVAPADTNDPESVRIGRRAGERAIQALPPQPLQVVHGGPRSGQHDEVGVGQVSGPGRPAQLGGRLQHKRVQVGRIGQVRQAHHGDPHRPVGALAWLGALRPRGRRIPVRSRRPPPRRPQVQRVLHAEHRLLAQVRQHPQHGQPGPLLQVPDRRVEQRDVAAHPVEHEALQARSQPLRQQRPRPVGRSEGTAPVDVDDEHRGDPGRRSQRQVDDIAVP